MNRIDTVADTTIRESVRRMLAARHNSAGSLPLLADLYVGERPALSVVVGEAIDLVRLKQLLGATLVALSGDLFVAADGTASAQRITDTRDPKATADALLVAVVSVAPAFKQVLPGQRAAYRRILFAREALTGEIEVDTADAQVVDGRSFNSAPGGYVPALLAAPPTAVASTTEELVEVLAQLKTSGLPALVHRDSFAGYRAMKNSVLHARLGLATRSGILVNVDEPALADMEDVLRFAG